MYHFWSWYPPVGVFIAILGVVGVLVPIFRPLEKIGSREKAVWTILVFALLLLEIRSIYLDREVHDKEQAEARASEERNFESIATGIQRSIDQSKADFDATMGKSKTTLETSEKTLKNTRPYAEIEFQGLDIDPASLPIAVGRQLTFNMAFTNFGND